MRKGTFIHNREIGFINNIFYLIYLEYTSFQFCIVRFTMILASNEYFLLYISVDMIGFLDIYCFNKILTFRKFANLFCLVIKALYKVILGYRYFCKKKKEQKWSTHIAKVFFIRTLF